MTNTANKNYKKCALTNLPGLECNADECASYECIRDTERCYQECANLKAQKLSFFLFNLPHYEFKDAGYSGYEKLCLDHWFRLPIHLGMHMEICQKFLSEMKFQTYIKNDMCRV